MSSSNGKLFTAIAVLALFGVGGALIENRRHANNDQKVVEPNPVPSVQEGAPGQNVARAIKSVLLEDRKTRTGLEQKPAFIAVNLDNDGTGTVAGKALPGTRVAFDLDGKTIETVDVSKSGDFSLDLGQVLASGQHILELKSYRPDGSPATQSEQRIELNIRKGQDIVVAILQPGKPPLVLQAVEGKLEEGGEASGRAANAGKKNAKASPQTKPRNKPGKTGELAATEPLIKLRAKSAEPLVGKSTSLATIKPITTKPKSRNISFLETVYLDEGRQAGQIKLSGMAQAGANLRFLIDDNMLGQVVADKSGTWSLQVRRHLISGSHWLVAEQLDAKGERVAYAGAPFYRTEPPVKVVGGGGKAPSSDGMKRALVGEALEKKGHSRTGWDKVTGNFKAETASRQVASVDALKMLQKSLASTLKSSGSRSFAFEALSYQSNRSGSELTLSGRGLPGSQVRLFDGSQKIGEVVADDNGAWSFVKRGMIKTGPHLFRAGHILKSGRIAAEARMQYDYTGERKVAGLEGLDSQKPKLEPAPGIKTATTLIPASKIKVVIPAGKSKKRDVTKTARLDRSSAGDNSGSSKVNLPSSIEKSKQAAKPVVVSKMQGVLAKPRIRKKSSRIILRAKRKRRKAGRRTVRRAKARRYYLNRKKRGKYFAKRRKYPRSKRTPARVRIHKGATLWGYSEHYYGRGKLYPHIARANKRTMKNPNRIYAGQRIQVPRLRIKRRNRR